jgi:hypothetical protein
MKKILLLASVSALCMNTMNAQSTKNNQLHIMAGYKTAEVAYMHTDSLICGIALSVTKSEMFEDEIIFKGPYLREVNAKYIPTIYGIIGTELNRFAFTLKAGLVYVDLIIDGKPKNPELHYATGMAASYDISNTFGLKVSLDNISKLMVGVTVRL